MKQAINTRTQEEYDTLMRYYDEQGTLWWKDRPAASVNYWPEYGEGMCVSFSMYNPNFLGYSGKSFYEREGYTIIPYTEFAKANIVEEKPKSRLFDPKAQQPIPSEDCPEFSVDVFIIDEKEMHGLACYHFEDKKWIFHTDTLVDYNEKGAETQWRWYYPDVQWGEESAEIDYKALYLEGRELLDEARLQIEYLHGKFKATGTGNSVLSRIKTFLTKHNDLTNHKDGE